MERELLMFDELLEELDLTSRTLTSQQVSDVTRLVDNSASSYRE